MKYLYFKIENKTLIEINSKISEKIRKAFQNLVKKI